MLNSGTDLQSSSLDLLDPDHLQRHELIQRHDCIHDHFGEEIFLTSNQLGVEGCGRTFLQQLPLLSEEDETGRGSFAATKSQRREAAEANVTTHCLSSFFTETEISLILLTARLVAVRNALMMV